MQRRLEYVLGLISFTAGTVDVSSFAKLNGVLASAMTGNLALLGLYIGRGAAGAALSAAVALIAFVAGASAGAWATRERQQIPALSLLLAAELLLLLLAAILWLATGHRSGMSRNGIIAFLAMAMGLQIVAGRQLNLASIPTVVFTSTLANLTAGVTHMLARNSPRVPLDVVRQSAALALYFCGALAAGICVYTGTPALVFLPAAAAAVALALLVCPRAQTE